MAAGLRERAVSAAVAVARGHGLDVRDPRVLSDRSNVLVELAPAQVVAGVATSTADVRTGRARDWLARDVALARHLAAAGARVVPPATEPPAGPHTQDGLAIAFWQLVRHDGATPVSPAEAAEALRRLHEALAGFPGELPPLSSLLDECEALIERLASRPAAPESAAASPVRLDRIRAALQGIRSEIAATGLQSRPLHGFLEARRLQGAVWTALVAERHPELRERAEERLSRWAAR